MNVKSFGVFLQTKGWATCDLDNTTGVTEIKLIRVGRFGRLCAFINYETDSGGCVCVCVCVCVWVCVEIEYCLHYATACCGVKFSVT